MAKCDCKVTRKITVVHGRPGEERDFCDSSAMQESDRDTGNPVRPECKRQCRISVLNWPKGKK